MAVAFGEGDGISWILVRISEFGAFLCFSLRLLPQCIEIHFGHNTRSFLTGTVHLSLRWSIGVQGLPVFPEVRPEPLTAFKLADSKCGFKIIDQGFKMEEWSKGSAFFVVLHFSFFVLHLGIALVVQRIGHFPAKEEILVRFQARAPISNFPIFARPIRPREARKGMETLARPARGGARPANRTDFSGQKEISDSVKSRKEKFS